MPGAKTLYGVLRCGDDAFMDLLNGCLRCALALAPCLLRLPARLRPCLSNPACVTPAPPLLRNARPGRAPRPQVGAL